MKKLFALLAVVLAVVSCQKDADLDVNMGGDVATISVALPADAITRAAADKTDSAWSGLQNEEGEVMTVTLYIFDENGVPSVEPYTQTLMENDLVANFEVRLVPDRNYRFVAWAGQVGAEDNFTINTPNEDVWNIVLNNEWTAMNESRDAFTGYLDVEDFNSAKTIPTLELTRPFAKLRVITTDMEWITNNNVKPTYAEVSYQVELPSSFNAYSQAIGTETITNKQHSVFEIKDYTEDAYGEMTLFTDYILAPEAGSVVKFILDVYEDASKEKLVTSTSFTTDIPVKRNNLTTIKGNILTDGNNINVEVKPEFGGEKEWPSETAEKLAAAAMFGGEVILTEDVTLTEPLLVKGNMTINLNGKTITNATNYAFENYAKLTINGDGIINGLGGIRSHGGEITINGGTFTCSSDWNVGTYNHILKAVNTKVVINGGTFDATIDGTTNAMINVSENSIIAINGGTFKNVNGTISQFAPYMFTYEKNGKLIINDGDFYGGWRFNGETATTDIYGGNFTVSYDGQSFHAASTHVLRVYGGVFDLNNGGKLNPTNYVATGYKAVQSGDKYMVVKEDVDGVATDNITLNAAIENAQNGDTIALNAGEYVIPDSAGGKTITFVGTGAPEDTLITAQDDGAAEGNCDYSLRGSKATFENVTITTTGTYFPGYAGCQGTYKNCIINGVFTLYDSSSFEDCTFNISGDLYNVWTWGAAEATFTNCTFNCDGKAMLLYGQANTKLTMNNCVFNDNGDNTVTGKAAIEIGNDYNKSYELTVNNATVNGFAINPNGFVTGTTLWANKNSMPADKLKVTVDGKNAYNYVVAANDTQSFTDAINNGATEVALSDGNYTMPEPDLRYKTLKITGTKDVVIDATAVDTRDQFVTGANISFEGVTVNFGNVNYMGFANAASLSYKNCKINGLQFLNGPVATFENCEFDSNGAEHSVWTYGCKEVNFIDCDFTYADRCVNCYKDQDIDGGKQTVNFTECTFTTTNTASAGAVEINSCFFSVGIEVNLNGCTAPAYGQMAYVSPWDSTNGAKTTINIK